MGCTALYWTLYTTSHHNPVNSSNYQQLPTIGQGVTRENQGLPTILFSEERGNCPISMTSTLYIYWYDLHISMSQPPQLSSHLTSWPGPGCRQTSSFVFKSALIFLFLELTNWTENTHRHTTPCLGRQGRRQADITFYFTFIRLQILILEKLSCKLASYKHSANFLKSTNCSKYKIYPRY